MSTGYYLLDNPNRTQQYRIPRRARLSGMVGIHTAEGAMDSVGIDTGAENVASFIVGRADYGSYHVIVDSDSTVDMAPDHAETWHIGADAHNWHSWGISAACRTVDWDPNSEWTKATIGRMGAAIAGFWQRNGFDVDALADRWLTKDQALRHEPGLIEHGVAQPADRSDAWATRPDRLTLRRMLTDAIRAANGTAPPPPPTEKDWFDMATEDDLRNVIRDEFRTHEEGDVAVQLDGALFRLIPQPDGGLKRRWIAGTAELAGLQQTGQVRRGDVVNITPDTEAWFRYLPAVPVPGTPF